MLNNIFRVSPHPKIIRDRVRFDDDFRFCFGFVDEFCVGAEPVEDVVDAFGFDTEMVLFGLAAVHERVIVDVLLDVDAVFAAFDEFDRFDGLVGSFNIHDALYAEMGDGVVFVYVADEVVSAVGGQDLVWVDKIVTGGAIVAATVVELFVGAVVAVEEFDFGAVIDGFMKDIEGIEELRVCGAQLLVVFVFGIPVSAQLGYFTDQVIPLVGGDAGGGTETVDDEVQFCRAEFMLIVPALVVDNRVSGGDKLIQISADAFAGMRYSGLPFQEIQNFFLAQAVVLVCILFEDPEDRVTGQFI